MAEFFLSFIANTIIFLSFAAIYCKLYMSNKDEVDAIEEKLEERIRLLSQRVVKLESELMHLRLR
jgi:hypothetical protein